MNLSKVGDMTFNAWRKAPRYISSCGGTRSGKTYSILQLWVLKCIRDMEIGAPVMVNSVVSETVPHLKRGAIRDFQSIMTAEGI